MKNELPISQELWEWLGDTLGRHAKAKIAPALIKLVMPGARLFEYTDGELIISENELGHEMYVIYQGGVSVSRNAKIIAELKAGDYFGEISLVAKVPRTATVKALKNCQVFELSWRAITAVDEYFPELMLNLQEVARQRTSEQESA